MIPVEKEYRETFLDCDCGCKKLLICRFMEDDPVNIYLSMFVRASHGSRLTWREVFRAMWWIVVKRKMYEDEIVINGEEAYRVGKWLIELSGEENAMEK